MKNPILSALILLISLAAANAAPRTIQVFVALCDNKSQGIAPVPARGSDKRPAAAGRAYARNQKIPGKAATGVFAKLDEKAK